MHKEHRRRTALRNLVSQALRLVVHADPVDRLQRLMPPFDLGKDGLALFGPGEGFGCLVMLGEVAVDRGPEVDQRVEHASLTNQSIYHIDRR